MALILLDQYHFRALSKALGMLDIRLVGAPIFSLYAVPEKDRDQYYPYYTREMSDGQ
jgi:hypothetical protein